MPQQFSSAVIQLGLECERIDLIQAQMDRGRPFNSIHQYMQVYHHAAVILIWKDSLCIVLHV